jgi:hypothetical protein
MRIDFECSGGLFPDLLRYHANTEDLAGELREKLERLVAESGVLDLQESDMNPSSGAERDVFSYRLTLVEGGKKKTLLVNDVTAPEGLHPLLALLRDLAVERRLGGSGSTL